MVLWHLVMRKEINQKGYGNKNIEKKTWVLHDVLYSNIQYHFQDKTSIEIKNLNYKTAYYYSSFLYVKNGFRIVAIFKPDDNSDWEILTKEYLKGC